MSDVPVEENLKYVQSKMEEAISRRPPEFTKSPRLVAVGKTKPLELILKAYNSGHRHFGENYVQELKEKSTNPEVIASYSEIKWHFIGHLQSNKVNQLLSVPNLFVVETVDSEKLANTLNKQWAKLEKENPLQIMVQVNTSGEENKSGISPSQLLPIVRHIINNCSSLKFIGIMTIGNLDHVHDVSQGENPDFACLRQCRTDLCKEFGWDVNDIELSMGMSNDFEHAIEIGSTNVRVGSTIFGQRIYDK